MRLILVNAIYFKGEWLEPFAEEWTTPGDFFLSNGLTVKTQMMKVSDLEHARYAAFNAVGTFFETPTMIRRGENVERYPGKDGFAIVELPYKGNRLAMVVIAPNSNDGLTAIEEQLSATILREWLVKLRQRAVHVHIPKFKLETYYALKKPLQSLGMVDAFVDPGRTGPPPPNTANFTGISEMNLWITKVLHKAFIEVNEKGTEAAAATALMMATATSMPMSTPFTPTFKANHPFLFLIVDKPTGAILFMGRFATPPAE
jgi:serpin B